MVSYWVSTNFLSNKLDDVVDRLILENILYKMTNGLSVKMLRVIRIGKRN